MGNSQTIYNAAEHGRLRRLKMWIRRYPRSSLGVLVNLRSRGRTPLIVACSSGHVDVVEYLIDQCGARLEQIGRVAGLDGPAAASPLWWATHHGHLNVVQSLVTRGANVNSDTPLVEACARSYYEIVQYLVANGADIGLAGLNGRTALDWACQIENYPIARLLIHNGADLSRDGAIVLQNCVSRFNLRFVRLLLRYGAKVDNLIFDMRPLMLTRCFEQPPRVEYSLCLPFIPRYPLGFLESLGMSCVDISRREPYRLPNERLVVERDQNNGHRVRMVRLNHGDSQWVSILQLAKSVDGPVDRAETTLCYIFRERYYFWQEESNVSTWELMAGMQRFASWPANLLTQKYIGSLTNMFVIMLLDDCPFIYQLVLAVFLLTVKEFQVAIRIADVTQESDLVQFNLVIESAIKLTFCLIHMGSDMSAEHRQLFYRSAYDLIRLDPRDNQGCTPLHMICSRKQTDFIPLGPAEIIKTFELFLDVGADASAVDERKNSPLHLVAKIRPVRCDVIELLRSRGAHFDARNADRKCFTELLPEEVRSKYRLRDCLSLKCLAAIAIGDHAVPHESVNGVPGLSQFVSLH